MSDLFPSKYLSAHDLLDDEGQSVDTVMTIKSWAPYTTQEGDPKVILTFDEGGKPLMGNKTNCKTIAKLYGDNPKDWLGKKITLFVTEVDMKGEQVDAIRIRSKPPRPAKPAAAPTGKTKPVTQKEADEAGDDFGDDETPF
jgi:hypothetical protein